MKEEPTVARSPSGLKVAWLGDVSAHRTLLILAQCSLSIYFLPLLWVFLVCFASFALFWSRFSLCILGWTGTGYVPSSWQWPSCLSLQSTKVTQASITVILGFLLPNLLIWRKSELQVSILDLFFFLLLPSQLPILVIFFTTPSHCSPQIQSWLEDFSKFHWHLELSTLQIQLLMATP